MAIAPAQEQHSNGEPERVTPHDPPDAGSDTVEPARVRDPDGGAPWAVRMARTRGGRVGFNGGRVQDGRFGAVDRTGELHELPLKRGRLRSLLRAARFQRFRQ